MRKYIPYILGMLLGAFALMTLYLSGSILFDLFDMRAKQGDYVKSIIWANFIASILYLIASYGFFTKNKFTCKALMIAIIVLIIGSIGFYIHIKSGGNYMNKTIKALGVRYTITLIFLVTAKFLFNKK